MKRAFTTALLLASLSAGPAKAAPEFRLGYPNGVPRVEIVGDYRNSHYTVWRAGSPGSQFTLVSESDVLCVGPCFADDYSAVGGHTYWYRFDVVSPSEGLLSFGPYRADISASQARRLSATVSPNPGRGPVAVTLFLAGTPGSAVRAEAVLFDLQGRRLATIHHGLLASGPSRFAWSGTADDGRELGSGLYLLRVVTADGRHAVARVVRSR